MDRNQKRKLKVLQGYVDEVMHYMWDPIGVAGIPEARSEYDGYVPHAVSLLLQSEDPVNEIAEYLVEVENDRMGVAGVGSEHGAREVAAVLIAYRDWIDEQFEQLE